MTNSTDTKTSDIVYEETEKPYEETTVDVVDDFKPEELGVALSTRDLTNLILQNPKIKQAVIILVTDDDDHVEFKGHFYDNAVLLNNICKDYKAKIYSEVFSDRPEED